MARTAILLAALLLASGATVCAQEPDDYAAMLGYLARTNIDDRAFSGASGAVAINMAAGDHNQQANLRSLAVGEQASASASALQHHQANLANAPEHASAAISGNAFQGASGLVSINQASGTGNAELNAVTVALAQRGIRETPDELLSSAAFASAGPQYHGGSGATDTATRSVAVDATALQGFEGVMQLNQIAGSANATDNSLLMSVQGGP